MWLCRRGGLGWESGSDRFEGLEWKSGWLMTSEKYYVLREEMNRFLYHSIIAARMWPWAWGKKRKLARCRCRVEDLGSLRFFRPIRPTSTKPQGVCCEYYCCGHPDYKDRRGLEGHVDLPPTRTPDSILSGSTEPVPEGCRAFEPELHQWGDYEGKKTVKTKCMCRKPGRRLFGWRTSGCYCQTAGGPPPGHDTDTQIRNWMLKTTPNFEFGCRVRVDNVIISRPSSGPRGLIRSCSAK